MCLLQFQSIPVSADRCKYSTETALLHTFIIFIIGLPMKVTALFLFLVIWVRPSTLLITINSWHSSITASAYAVTFYRGLTVTDRSQFVRIDRFSPQEHILHLRSASRLRSWANTVQYLYFTQSPLSLNRTTPVNNICRLYTALYCSLSAQSLPHSRNVVTIILVLWTISAPIARGTIGSTSLR